MNALPIHKHPSKAGSSGEVKPAPKRAVAAGPLEVTRKDALAEFDRNKVSISTTKRPGGYVLHLAKHLDVTGVGGTESEAMTRLEANWEERSRHERELERDCAAKDRPSR